MVFLASSLLPHVLHSPQLTNPRKFGVSGLSHNYGSYYAAAVCGIIFGSMQSVQDALDDPFNGQLFFLVAFPSVVRPLRRLLSSNLADSRAPVVCSCSMGWCCADNLLLCSSDFSCSWLVASLVSCSWLRRSSCALGWLRRSSCATVGSSRC
jgi:hypothetical protein